MMMVFKISITNKQNKNKAITLEIFILIRNQVVSMWKISSDT